MKIYIETLGCPKNVNDSEMAAGFLEASGHCIVDRPEEADAVMVNTCGFIEDAKKESIQAIFDMAKTGKMLIVSGCLSQRYGEELYQEMPEVDLFLGVNDYSRLPQILAQHEPGRRERYLSADAEEREWTVRKLKEHPYSATLKIAEGCDNRCTFCAIPSIRGPYRSRSETAILEEAGRLADAGTKELILIAQDTTAWGMDLYHGEYRLPVLLRKLCRIDGIRWIRLMYCYEDRITEELIRTIAEEPKLCHYLDLPLQHGSDRILKRMARRSTRAEIDATLHRLRAEIPDLHLRTTLMTGFPGETEEDFRQLLEMVEEEKFERLGVFAYSVEDGTLAAEMDDQVPEEIKEERKNAIMRRQMDLSLQSNQKKIGTDMLVLLEEPEEQTDGVTMWNGRTEYDAPEIDCSVLVAVKQEHCPGDMIRVHITDAFDYDLIGKEIES